jgi:WS/DGAT/MGAT family acyltransferase
VPGATVNDVVLAIVGGALRRFLKAEGELPDGSLVAMAPISIRTGDQAGTQGNQVAMMLVSLATDEVKPLDRLAAIQASTANSKEITQAIGARTLADYSQFIPAAVAGLASRAYTRSGLANRSNPIYTTTVTNVPGPQEPLYFCGAELVAYWGLGPIVDGMGLIHPVLSYNGHLSISFTSCPEMLPDPPAYAACLKASFDELVKAARKAAA